MLCFYLTRLLSFLKLFFFILSLRRCLSVRVSVRFISEEIMQTKKYLFQSIKVTLTKEYFLMLLISRKERKKDLWFWFCLVKLEFLVNSRNTFLNAFRRLHQFHQLLVAISSQFSVGRAFHGIIICDRFSYPSGSGREVDPFHRHINHL